MYNTFGEITKQKEQLERYMKWFEEEGGIEFPVRLSTYFNEIQIRRLNWLKYKVEGTILEVGCSWGYVLSYVDGDVGLDKFEHNIQLAHVLAPTKKFIVGDAIDLLFEDDEFDSVLLPEVLEHIPFENVTFAIQEALRVARKKVLITLPLEKHLAQSFKHKWIVTDTTMRQIFDVHDNRIYVADDNFAYLELTI